MNFSERPKARHEDLIVRPIDGEVLIYDLNSKKAHCLNETSALVWSLCDGQRTASEISRAMTKTLRSQIQEELVWLALVDLQSRQLLSGIPQVELSLKGLSRRDIIRRVGVTSLVALPLISSLVSPAAAQSSSCLAEGATCSDSAGTCCPGLECNPSCGQCVASGGLGGCL